MESKYIECKDNGIYGIYVIDDVHQNEELIYVGKTRVSFESRFESHMKKFNSKNNKSQLKLYNRIRQAKRAGLRVELRPLIQLDKVKWNKELISKHDLEMMEITVITMLKPECNWEGVDGEYLFGYERASIGKEQFE